MNDTIKNAGIIAVSAAAVVASSVYVYTSVIEDNKVPEKETVTVVATATPSPAATTTYKNGTYKAAGDYDTSGPTRHKMEVTITLAGDVVTAASTELKDETISAYSLKSNTSFNEALKTEVVGKKLDEVSTVARVSTSSDTTTGFKSAVELVKSQAKQ